MRSTRALALLGLAMVAACASKPKATTNTPVNADGMARYTEHRMRGNIACGAMPVVIASNRNAVRLTGGCRDVRITGNRNDIHVETAPGALIQITGEHNDVTWHQAGDGPKPTLKNDGKANDFHVGKD